MSGTLFLADRFHMSIGSPILLADRDAAVLQSLTFWLRAEGHQVLPFTSGEAILASGLPNSAVLVMDHDLGDLTAVELLERLRETGRSYPAIVMASKRSGELSHAAAAYGFELFEKPLLTDDLLNSINNLVASSAD
jgi:FixJ family two-component response regulator